MEQKLSNEEYRRIYGMYIGCEIQTPSPYDDEPDRIVNGYLTGIHGEYQAEVQHVDIDGGVWEHPEYYNFDKCKLILTPLSEISDEDAIQANKIMGFEYSNEDGSEAHFDLEGFRDWITEMFNWEQITVDGKTFLQLFQYLISKSYAVPLFFGVDHWSNGKTAIELGIAIPHSH